MADHLSDVRVMARLLGLTCRGLLMAVSLLIAYVLIDAARREEPNPTVRVLMVIVAALALVAALAVWSRRRAAVQVQILVFPLLAALYLFEWSRVDPVDQMLHVEESAKILEAQQLIPLSGVSSLPTLMCREGPRPFAEFVADEHGFNNPKGVWGRPVDVVLIGDSMTYGACLPNPDHFVARIRERFPATLNLGQGGIGPLVELAIVREFVDRTRPRYVVYLYDENNDVYVPQDAAEADLAREYRSRLLRKYLDDDGFSQRLIDRQPEIDAVLKRDLDTRVASALARRRPWKALLGFLALPLTREGLRWIGPRSPRGWGPGSVWAAPDTAATVPPDGLALFKQVFAKTVQVAQSAGARFVFVSIPAQATLCNGVAHPWKRAVLEFATHTGVDVIDLEKDYRRAVKTMGREQVFAVPPCGGHFSEAGYQIIGHRVLEYLEMREARRLTLLPEGWSVVTAHPRPRANTPPAVLSRWTQVYEAYAHVDRPFPAAPDAADRTHGAAIMGNSYVPRRAGSTLRVGVEFTAFSPRDNEIVAALFVAGEARARRVAVQPVTAGTTASVTLTHSLDLVSEAPLPIEVRVGPRRPGTIYINGVDRGPSAPPRRTSLTLEELGNEEPRQEALPQDQLVYRGTDVDDRDIAAMRQAALQRDQPAAPRAPSALARAYLGARRWVNRRIAAPLPRLRQRYEPYARVDRVIGNDKVAVDREGAAIMGYSFVPAAAGNVIRVTVAVPAWTDQPNSIVAALFMNEATVTHQVQSRELGRGQVATATLDFETTAPSVQPISFTVRVGPGRPGAIHLNGDGKGPSATVPTPTLTIDEYRTIWP